MFRARIHQLLCFTGDLTEGAENPPRARYMLLLGARHVFLGLIAQHRGLANGGCPLLPSRSLRRVCPLCGALSEEARCLVS